MAPGMNRKLPSDWLDQRLLQRGLTAREVAKMAGLHEQTVGAARRGGPIAPRTLRQICRALDATPVLDPYETPAAELAPDQSRRAIHASSNEVGE